MEEIRPFDCPECPCSFSTEEDLGTHIERHAPIGKPRWAKKKQCPLCTGSGCPECLYRKRQILTELCPKGCRRHFPKRNGTVNLDFNQHMRLCNGATPLRSVPRDNIRNGRGALSGGRPSSGPVKISIDEVMRRNRAL